MLRVLSGSSESYRNRQAAGKAERFSGHRHLQINVWLVVAEIDSLEPEGQRI